MEFKKRSLEEFINRIEAREPFAFSRWGNGEWDSLFGRTKGRNRSGHHYFPQLGVELREVLLNHPAYMLGMQNLAVRLYEGRIEEWLIENRLDDLDWIDADVFHTASIRSRLFPLVEALREAPALVIVGPAHLRKLKRYLGFDELVEVPLPDCYLTMGQTLKDVRRKVKNLPSGAVVGFSAAMPANLMIDALVRDPKFSHHTFIDFGSLWDPYAGVKSRSYMKDMDVDVVP